MRIHIDFLTKDYGMAYSRGNVVQCIILIGDISNSMSVYSLRE